MLFIVVVAVCVLTPAYTSPCKGLEYLLKVGHIILVDPNRVGFLISNTGFVAGWKHCRMSE